jgi:hypothetical protein
MRRVVAGVGAAVVLLCVSARAGATGKSALDPFRHEGVVAAARAERLNPFRLAQAAPPAAPVSTPAPAPAAGKSCQVDEDCAAESFCAERGMCEVIQTRTNILYLYYHEGSFREVLGLYWSKRGPSGYTVVAPFFWHFWSPRTRTRAVAPFFWRHENFATGYRATVIVPGLPISWSSQPGASSFGVWPLFYRSTKFGWAAPLFGSFEIADPDNHKAFGALLFLYWWKRSPTHDRDLGIPFLYSTRSAKSAFTWVLPLTFYWRDNDDKNLLLIPLLYWSHQKNSGSLYALAGYHTRDGDERSGALLWLYWFGSNQHDRSGYDVFFPLIWSFHSPAANTTVAGPFVHLRRKTWYFDTAFPLWWGGGDPAKGQSFRTLLPFFYWQGSEHGKKSLWVTPIGGYSRDDLAGSRTLVLLPLILTRHDRTSALQIFTPAFVRTWSDQSGATTKLIGGLLYLRNDPAGSTSALFPLFWRFRDAASGATATALLPFFARRSGPTETSTYAGVFPLWAFKRSFHDGPENGWSAGLFPLGFFGRRGESSHAVVFPLFWRFKNAGAVTTVALPLYYHHADRDASSTGIFPLLAFFGHDGDSHYAIQFPLWWHFSNPRQGWSTTVTPLGYHHADSLGWGAGLPPLFFVGGGPGHAHLAVVPIFWHFRDDAQQKSTTVALLYLHRTHGGETTDALFPLFHYRRGARPGGSDETSFTLFPLIHYRRDATSRVLATPLGASWTEGARAAGFIGPYLWYRSPNLAARGIPLIYFDARNQVTGEHTRQIGPWFEVEGPGHRARVLFPLYGRYDEANEHDTYVFPTYFRQRRSDGSAVDSFLPLYWHSHLGARSTTIVTLWYRHRDPATGVHDTGVAPLYFYAKNNERSLLVAPPLLLYRRADFKDHTVRMTAAALIYHSSAADSHTTVVFPLWWSGHEKARSHRVLFPLYWHFANQDDQSTLNVAGPLFWSSSGTWRTQGLVPIAWRSHDTRSSASSLALLPLFYEAHGGGRFRLLTLLAGYSASVTSHTWYVGTIFASDGLESRSLGILPLWYSHENKLKETRTQVVLPLLLYAHRTPQTALTTVLALFWHHRDIASSTTLVLPLYYDFHEVHESRTTFLVPLFFRHHRDSDDTTFTVAPLFYRRSNPTESTTVAFPLFWDFRSGANRTTLFVPFFAHWRRPTYAATWVFPTYYYREGLTATGPDGTYRRLVVPFFESAVKRRGDYMWEVLGGLFGHERVGRNRYLKVFFLTFESRAPARAQTSWYSQPQRISRREPIRSLSANVW